MRVAGRDVAAFIADPKVDPHEPDMMLFAKEGWVFGDTAARRQQARADEAEKTHAAEEADRGGERAGHEP